MSDDDFRSLDDVYDAVVERLGVKLFTILGFADGGATMRRIYSNHPVEYPVGGTKDTSADVAADWLAVSLVEQRPYFGRTPADVSRIFADHDLIESLGCGSIINVPVIADERTVAALSILDAEGAYDMSSVDAAEDIARRSANAVTAALSGAGRDERAGLTAATRDVVAKRDAVATRDED